MNMKKITYLLIILSLLASSCASTKPIKDHKTNSRAFFEKKKKSNRKKYSKYFQPCDFRKTAIVEATQE